MTANVLYSRKGPILLLVYFFGIILIWVALEMHVVYGTISIIMCMIYLGLVLQPKPWDSRTPEEREGGRHIWSLLVALSCVLTLRVIALITGITSRGSETTSFLGAIGFGVISIYLDRKVSEKYLKRALKDGGIQVYLGPRPEEWDKPAP